MGLGSLAPLNTKAECQVIFGDAHILKDELSQKCLHLVGEEILKVRKMLSNLEVD